MGHCNAKFLTAYLMLNIPPKMKTFQFSIPMNPKKFINVNDAIGTNGKSQSCHLLRKKLCLKNLNEKTFITLEHRLHTRILTRSRRLVIGKSGRPSELDSLVIIVLAKDNNCDNLK